MEKKKERGDEEKVSRTKHDCCSKILKVQNDTQVTKMYQYFSISAINLHFIH
jgi:hypothetical protein